MVETLIKQFKEKLELTYNDQYTFVKAEYKLKKNKNVLLYTTRCNKCGYEKTGIFTDFFKGFECRGCRGLRPYTTEEYKKQVFDLVGEEYTVLGEYINGTEKIRIRHNCEECNYFEWDVIARNFTRPNHPTRCKICNTKLGVSKLKEFKMKEAKENFYKNFTNQIANSNDFELLSEYIDDKTPLILKCKKCKNTFTRIPRNIISPKIIRCDYCEELSKPIIKIISYLKKYKIKFYKECYFPKFKSLKNGNCFRYDLFLPDYNLIIEYDGEQHFSKSNTYNSYDLEFYDQLKNLKILISSKYSLLRLSNLESNKIEEILYNFLIEGSTRLIKENNIFYINNDSSITYNYSEYYDNRNKDNNFSLKMIDTVKFYLLDEDIVSSL